MRPWIPSLGLEKKKERERKEKGKGRGVHVLFIPH
jgi:hypothetical protein